MSKLIDVIVGAHSESIKIAPIIEAPEAAERRRGSLRHRVVHAVQRVGA